MDEKQSRQLKEILKSEFLPLFVGLRSELKTLNTTVADLLKKEPPAVQKVENTNHPDPIKSVEVSNLPEKQKVEITNLPEGIQEVEVKGIANQFARVTTTLYEGVKSLSALIGNNWNEAKAHEFKVNVQNIAPYPKSIKVDNLDEIVIPPSEFPSHIKISNSLPADAIPVILTDRDRKNFYNAIQQMYFANDVNLDRLLKAIQNINIDGITVDLTDIENLITITNQILNDILLALGGAGVIQQVFGVQSVSALTETTLTSYTVPVGKSFNLSGYSCEGVEDGLFKIYVGVVKIWQGRNAWTQRTLNGDLLKSLSAGQTVYLKVENLRNQAHAFSGTLYGEEI